MKTHGPSEKVIYERSPVDYLAYILALQDLGREILRPNLFDSVRKSVAEASSYLDLIVFLPLEDQFAVPDEEDSQLRNAVDNRLAELFSNGEISGVKVVVATSSTAQRMRTIEAAI